MGERLLIAQITDLHIDDRSPRVNPLKGDTRERLSRVVAYLNAFEPRPDLVLTTGDLTDFGTAAEYAALRSILDRLDMPNFIIPGNHDRRDALREACSDHGYLPRDGFLQYVIDGYPVRLIGLDTLVPGQEGGALCSDRLAWLEDRLCEDEVKPTLIFMHHPPYVTGMPQLDDVNCRGGDRMAKIVARHHNVAGIVCGHLHRATSVRFGGTVAVSVPAVAPELALILGTRARPNYVPSPPQFGLHLLSATGLVTHIVAVPDNPKKADRVLADTRR